MKNISVRQAALIAGISLLFMTILAIFANFFVIQGLVDEDDGAKTTDNIKNNETLYRFGILAFILVIIPDIVVAWALYIFLKPVNESLSLLMSWLRLIYAAIFGAAVMNLVRVLSFINDPSIDDFSSSIDAFRSGWNLALIIFGLHLILLGYLAFGSGYIPKFIGILLIIAGAGYSIDSIIELMVPDYGGYLSMATFIGELIFMMWLMFWGRKIDLPESA